MYNILSVTPSKHKRSKRSKKTLAQTTVPAATLQALDEIAEEDGHTRSSYLRLMIVREVKRQKRQSRTKRALDKLRAAVEAP